MIENFTHIGSGKLIFGSGEFSKISELVKLEDSLLVCGNSFLKSNQYKNIKQYVKFQKTISGEPEPEVIDRITTEVKGKILYVIAIGGGSVLDAGKAIAAMCCSEGSVEDFLEGVGTKKPNGKTLPMIAVPTTAGTGSEATKNAVICRRGEEGYKKSLRHDNYIPRLIIIDPELYRNCPGEIMSSCGMDAFSQLLESYISDSASMYTDTLAWQGLTLFIKNFVELCTSDTKDREVMGNIAFAAYLSGITLANAGLGTVHGIAGPMGGFYDIPHGTACGTLLPEVIERTVEKLYREKDGGKSLKKLEKLGLYIQEQTGSCRPDNPAYAVSEMLNSWLDKLNIPRLSPFGIDKSAAKKIASASGNKNNPVQFSKEEILEIIYSRL